MPGPGGEGVRPPGSVPASGGLGVGGAPAGHLTGAVGAGVRRLRGPPAQEAPGPPAAAVAHRPEGGRGRRGGVGHGGLVPVTGARPPRPRAPSAHGGLQERLTPLLPRGGLGLHHPLLHGGPRLVGEA
jgi:hypothetical protein